jgi:hypothetical protein
MGKDCGLEYGGEAFVSDPANLFLPNRSIHANTLTRSSLQFPFKKKKG